MYSSSISGESFDNRIYVLSDDSGYYFTGTDSTGKANIWKYLFDSPGISQCQRILFFQSSAFGLIKLSENSLFTLGSDPLAPYALYFLKFSFGNSSPDWNNKMSCFTGTCTAF